MAERKDNKGRILRNGEYQKSNGRYEYRYLDINGVKRSVYSWRLTSSDKMPKGKKVELPLREIEKNILKELDEGIDVFNGKRLTLNDCFDASLKTRQLKLTTIINYSGYYNNYVRNGLGKKCVVDIKFSDIKSLYLSIIKKGVAINSLKIIHAALHPVFEEAKKNGYIARNPTNGIIRELNRVRDISNENNNERILTEEQQDRLMSFISSSNTFKKNVPLFTFLLGTGCRVGETIGLTWDDIDFDRNLILINHTTEYIVGKEMETGFIVTSTKTKSGNRKIPMLDNVRKMLVDEYERQQKEGFCELEIGGKTRFIFFNRNKHLISNEALIRRMMRIRKAYNKQESANAEIDGRKPVLLPHFTPHTFRRTFCTRLCENEVNLKVIQSIMGHSTITITMNVYAEITEKKMQESIRKLTII